MRVLVHLLCISLLILSGIVPASVAASHVSIKIEITHTHEHEHDGHHHVDHDAEAPTTESQNSAQSAANSPPPADRHHSDQHSHEHFVSCGHQVWLGASHFETAAIEFSNVHSFEFKRSVPPSRALGSIFRPPILA
jgi:hypothetical protein